jgi:hypothetical protein
LFVFISHLTVPEEDQATLEQHFRDRSRLVDARMSVEESAEVLLSRKEEVAQAVTAALYRARPELLERYGERGRARCLEDMRYNIEHLVPALALERPAMFAGYVTWVDGLLRARNVPTEDLRLSLRLLQDEAARVVPADLQSTLTECVRAGLAALDQVPTQ